MLRRVAAVVLLAACAPPGDARRAWLVDALVDDNRIWLNRDPALLAAKYRTMADDPYDFMRGTAGVFLRDLARGGTGRDPTSFLEEPAAWGVLLAGDPHPENFGTHLWMEGPGPPWGDAPELTLEVNDFDGALFGPYLLDVRRAALGMAVLLDGAGCDARCRAPVIEALARGYVDEIEAQGAGAAPRTAALIDGRMDAVSQDLHDDVVEEGWLRVRLQVHTRVTARGRRFRFDDEVGDGRALRPCSVSEAAQLDRLLAQLPAPPGFRVLGTARRYGQGVASLPAIRYVVAFDRGDDGPDDDEMLSLREVVDPGSVPGLHAEAPALLRDQADRITAAPRWLWSRPDADPRLAAVVDGAQTFKVQTWSSWFDPYNHERIGDDIEAGQVDAASLAAWAARIGATLAALHARAPTAAGGRGLQAIQRDLAARDEVFVAERLRDVAGDLRRTLHDHERFEAALADHGPLLGADAGTLP